MTIVTGKLIGAASPQRVEMKATLVDVTGQPAVGYVASVPGELVKDMPIQAASDGTWQVTLIANALIDSVAGDTLWAIQEGRTRDGSPISTYVVVPATGGPHWAGAIRADLSLTQTGQGTVVYLPGAPGEQGPAGPSGPKGETGDTGPTGATGAQGAKGDTGDQGPQGATGDTGAQGPAGPKGDTGDTGPAGVSGSQGPAGPQGEQGETGPQGPAGSGGSSITSRDGRIDAQIIVLVPVSGWAIVTTSGGVEIGTSIPASVGDRIWYSPSFLRTYGIFLDMGIKAAAGGISRYTSSGTAIPEPDGYAPLYPEAAFVGVVGMRQFVVQAGEVDGSGNATIVLAYRGNSVDGVNQKVYFGGGPGYSGAFFVDNMGPAPA